MLLGPFAEIAIADLKRLVSDTIAERREIEYKEKLPGRSEDEKVEFLRDVSSFANAVGGHLIYGIKDKRDGDGQPTGIPEAVVGVGARINVGATINGLENSIRTGTSPRVIVEAKEIPGAPSGSVIVFHIPRGYSSPHMVTLGGDDGFYTRNSAGKHKLSVDEIKSAFLASDSLGERLRSFRTGRIARIIAGATPVPLVAGTRVVLHVIPFAAETGVNRVAVSLMESQIERLRPIISGSGWNSRYNYEGFATYSSRRNENEAFSYVQVFRTGALEAVDALTISEHNGKLTIPGMGFEKKMVEALGAYLQVEKDLGLVPPVMVAITLIGVRGAIMSENLEARRRYDQEEQPLDHENLYLPELVAEEYGLQPERILRPAFDTLWQSLGWPRSIYYDGDGNWKPQ